MSRLKGCQGRGLCECRKDESFEGMLRDVPLGPPLEEAMLQFDTGATRNRKENELAYEGFLHPLVLQHFARYMHKHRVQADGSTRAPDNWQKGMPDESYLDSLLRHVMDLWLIQRGYPEAAREAKGDALAACIFNIQGLTLNYLISGEGE